ncbi:MAG: UvrD-helicase domain-containing protein, partial [Clostridia bacterium]|nr:UvrD-helicase domain-containing protein [Clostridia bacterium]
MSRNWTAEQRAAMEICEKDLLVSAAAGSGKTATLTERILRRILASEHPADISKLLVVTFTKAAAAELRARLFSALNDALARDPTNRHLSSQLMKLGAAHICTIDAFYSELVRTHFSELGISPSFRIADSAELDVLAEQTMRECIEYHYENETVFPELVECFQSVRGQGRFLESMIDLDDKLSAHPKGLDFLGQCIDEYQLLGSFDFMESRYGAIFHYKLQEAVQYLEILLHDSEELLEEFPQLKIKFEGGINGDAQLFSELKELLKSSDRSYASFYKFFAFLSFVPTGRHRITEYEDTVQRLADHRKQFKETMLSLQKLYAVPPEDLDVIFSKTGNLLCAIRKLLTRFEEEMEDKKKKRNIMSFHDIRKKAYSLLVDEYDLPTEIAKHYAERFEEIYIDEYQDVDHIQDAIFSAISNGHNRFMVGDIKQSIYRFRGAVPALFADYRERFPAHHAGSCDDDTGLTVFMSENFRCDQSVIDVTNHICSFLFSSCAQSISYQREDDLIFAKPTEKDALPPVPVSIAVLLPPEKDEVEADETDERSGAEREADYIADEIEKLLAGKGLRPKEAPFTPDQIAVLTRTKKTKAIIAKALGRRGIPVSDDDASRYFDSEDVQLMLCLLNSVDNPRRDIPLTGTLRSPLFGFELDDLIRIRQAAPPDDSLYDALIRYKEHQDDALSRRCTSFLDLLSQWREEAASLPIDRFLQVLFRSEPLVTAGLLTQPGAKGGNLIQLYEYARSFEAYGFRGLYQFIEFLNKLIEQKKDLQLPSQNSAKGGVSLLTIHQSPGLEFRACFVAGL